MLVYIIVGSVREGRTAIKIANWLETTIPSFNLKDFQTEVIDLKVWNLPSFSGSHPPATGIYDQPKQQEWADKIAQADAFIFIRIQPRLQPSFKNALDYVGKEWSSKPAAFIGYGSTNGSRSISQIRQVTSSLSIVDPNAVIEIRDIFKRNKDEKFEANEFEVKGLQSIVDKLQKYHLS